MSFVGLCEFKCVSSVCGVGACVYVCVRVVCALKLCVCACVREWMTQIKSVFMKVAAEDGEGAGGWSKQGCVLYDYVFED